MRQLTAVLSMAVLLSACGSDGGDGLASEFGAAPQISGVAPSVLQVGDEVAILGSNFMTANEGKTYLQLKGRYFDDAGEAHPYERTVDTRLVGGTELRWKLWPDVVFQPQGNRLGFFLGEVRVVNESLDGTRRVSNAHNVRFDVAPSLILRVLRPTRRPADSVLADSDGPCSQMVVSSTTEDTPLTVAVEALGLMPGSESQPLVFTWNFSLDNLVVTSGSFGTIQTSADSRSQGAVTVIHEATNGVPFSGLTDASSCTTAAVSGLGFVDGLVNSLCRNGTNGERQYLFKVIDDLGATSGGIKVLKTRIVPEESPDGHAQGTITVSAEDATGSAASLHIPLDIYRQFVIRRTAHNDHITRREAPVKVAEDTSTASLPIEVTHRETHSQTKSVDKGSSLSPSTRANVGFIYALDLTTSFSLDVRESISSNTDRGHEVSQSVLPGMCVSYYRQAAKVRRYAEVTTHGACGEHRHLGEIHVDDWQWQREIANDPHCPARSKMLKPEGPCYEDCEVVSAASSVLDDFWRN